MAIRYSTSAVGTNDAQIAPATAAPATVARVPVAHAKASMARGQRRRTATGKLTTTATGQADQAGHDDDGPGGSSMVYLMNSARMTATAASATPLRPSRRAHSMTRNYRPTRSPGICPR